MVYILKHLSIACFLLIGPVLGVILGNPAYTVQEGPKGTKVFSTGYQNGRSPVDLIIIDDYDHKIIVKAAWNAHDQAPNRLFLSEIMLALWNNEGHSPRDINIVMFTWVVNEDTKTAIAGVRSRLRIGASADFDVAPGGVGWDTLLATPLGKTAARVAAVARKRMVKIRVTDAGLDDIEFDLQPL